jgi:hypothetical protein
MAHSTCHLMAVLANLGPGVRRGGSCACPGVASRVVVLESLLGHGPYASSRVRLTGIGSCTAVGVVASRQLGFPWCWGWPCSAWDGDTATGMAAQG